VRTTTRSNYIPIVTATKRLNEKRQGKPLLFCLLPAPPTPPHCFQRTTGEFEGVLQTPLMPCPAVCCKVSEAFCPYNGKSDTGTGKLCFSVSVGVAYGTGQIETVKGERVEISARKYYPNLDWLKAERAVSAVKRKISKAFRYSRKPSICPVERLCKGRWGFIGVDRKKPSETLLCVFDGSL